MNPTRTFYPFSQLPGIAFAFLKTTLSGGFLTFFLITFLTFEDPQFTRRFAVYQKWFLGFWLVGITVLLFWYLFFHRFSEKRKALAFPVDEEFRGLLWFVLGQSLILLAGMVNFRPPVLDFLLFLLALGLLLRRAQVYAFFRERPSWYHPTTAGNVIQAEAATGISLAFLGFPESELQHVLAVVLVVVLALELLTTWSRLRYLNRASPVTRQTVVMTLGSHLMLFAVRFIFGIIMPLVYLLWYLLISPLSLAPLPVMVLVGELSERILFFITAPPVLSGVSRN